VAEKLRTTIAAAHPAHSERQVTASFGVAVLPDEARDGAELLRIADRALYTAKANGRDRVEVAATA
jgi:diguanylate cyclase (GGDEF)-like protein